MLSTMSEVGSSHASASNASYVDKLYPLAFPTNPSATDTASSRAFSVKLMLFWKRSPKLLVILSRKDLDVFLGANSFCPRTASSGTTNAAERAMSGIILMSFILVICEGCGYLGEREENKEGRLISYKFTRLWRIITC